MHTAGIGGKVRIFQPLKSNLQWLFIFFALVASLPEHDATQRTFGASNWLLARAPRKFRGVDSCISVPHILWRHLCTDDVSPLFLTSFGKIC